MSYLAVRHTFNSNDQIIASYLNDNNNDIASVVNGGITSNNLDANAGILATQLADRYSLTLPSSFQLVPAGRPGGFIGWEGSIFPGTETANYCQMPPNGTWGVVDRMRVVLDTGQDAYLTRAELYVLGQYSSGAGNPQFRIRKNATLILGGDAVTLDTDSIYYTLTNLDPTDDPQITVVNGDELTFEFSASGAGNPYLLGVSLKLYWKIRLTN